MVSPTRWRRTIYLVLAVVLVLSSSLLHTSLTTVRDTWSRGPAGASFPPSIVLGTQMLGSFRGMLVMGLWMRAQTLQDEGRYFELVQLYNWITQLEPGIEDVWVFSAWNMAYNVSVAFSLDTPTGYEERWRWVQNGLAELRDRGVRLYLPSSYLLHHQLAWIYFHKVGRDSDEAHWYYKQQMAAALHPILGGPTPDYGRLARALDPDNDPMKDRAVVALVEAMRAAGFDPLARGLDWLNAHAALPDGVKPVVEAKEGSPELDALDAFLRARALRDRWSIDPAYAKQLIDQYGPLDFRQPEAHGLYWGAKSLEHVRPTDNRMFGERMVYFALVQIYESGRLYYDPARGLFDRRIDLRFSDWVRDHFAQIFETYPEQQEGGVDSAYRHWMHNAIVTLYIYNEKAKAAEYLKSLADEYGRPEYKLPVEEFVLLQVKQDLDDKMYEQVASNIVGFMLQSYYWLAYGEAEAAAGHEIMAQQFHRLFVERAPERFLKAVGSWDNVKRAARDFALSEEGMPKPLRDELRRILGLPPEEEAPTAPEM
ncbi:MAG: hypothetical protein JW889_08290 [Verrucomicrobia bacterium]|nr:hypothetical protein [Verrucomicrobiota bacterium]